MRLGHRSGRAADRGLEGEPPDYAFQPSRAVAGGHEVDAHGHALRLAVARGGERLKLNLKRIGLTVMPGTCRR